MNQGDLSTTPIWLSHFPPFQWLPSAFRKESKLLNKGSGASPALWPVFFPCLNPFRTDPPSDHTQRRLASPLHPTNPLPLSCQVLFLLKCLSKLPSSFHSCCHCPRSGLLNLYSHISPNKIHPYCFFWLWKQFMIIKKEKAIRKGIKVCPWFHERLKEFIILVDSCSEQLYSQ